MKTFEIDILILYKHEYKIQFFQKEGLQKTYFHGFTKADAIHSMLEMFFLCNENKKVLLFSIKYKNKWYDIV